LRRKIGAAGWPRQSGGGIWRAWRGGLVWTARAAMQQGGIYLSGPPA